MNKNNAPLSQRPVLVSSCNPNAKNFMRKYSEPRVSQKYMAERDCIQRKRLIAQSHSYGRTSNGYGNHTASRHLCQ